MKDFKFIAVDPGSRKCGVAVMDSSGAALEKCMADSDKIESVVAGLLNRHPDISLVAIGSGTGSDSIIKKLKSIPGIPGAMEILHEKNTTLEARKIYETEHPRPWPLSMIPFGLFGLPEDMDAYAAVAIGRKFLETKKG